MKFNLFQSRKRANEKGYAPIYAKIEIHNKIYERSSGVFVEQKKWNNVFKRANPDANDYARKNEQISLFETKLNQAKINNLDIYEIDNLLKNKEAINNDISINNLINDFLEKQQKKIDKPDGITKTTYRTYKCKIDNLVSFLTEIKKQHLPINKFTYDIGENYKAWLYNKNYCTGHINKCLKFVKSLMLLAQYEYSINPTNLMLLKLKEAKAKPIVYLTETELQQMQQKVYVTSTHQKTADLFLLQCFTGMAYSDIIKLDTNSIISSNGNNFITYQRTKTGVKGIIPLLPQVETILKRYNGVAPVMSNECYNRMLKELAAINGIEKRLTSHVGRKTFACMLVSKGVSMEATTKMLAKTSVRETERIYAEVQFAKILAEMPSFG